MIPIELEILNFQDDWYFAPIRNSIDYIKILLRTCQNLLLKGKIPDLSSNKIGEIKIWYTRKFSRVFYFKDNKFYSLHFPFDVFYDTESKLYSLYLDKMLVDNKLIHEITLIINNAIYTEHKSVLDFYLHYTPEGIDEIISDDSIICLEKLTHIEPSYIRYDCDEKNQDEKYHPLHHFDINYTEKSKIKIGIKDRIDLVFFKNFLDSQEKCIYLDQTSY